MTDTAPAHFPPADRTPDAGQGTPAPRRKKRRGGQRAGKAPGTAAAAPATPTATTRARSVHPLLERLFELHPRLFGARFLPLKLGTYEDLLARHPGEFPPEELKVALGLHARSTRYLEAVATGEKRHDLDGAPVEDLAPEHVHHAIVEVFRRRQSRTDKDLRPWLRERLLEAIVRSGLTREDYLLRMTTRDEAARTALDEAFAELGARTARREALQRAFEASGQTLAAFAEMYGMDPAEVTRVLHGDGAGAGTVHEDGGSAPPAAPAEAPGMRGDST